MPDLISEDVVDSATMLLEVHTPPYLGIQLVTSCTLLPS